MCEKPSITLDKERVAIQNWPHPQKLLRGCYLQEKYVEGGVREMSKIRNKKAQALLQAWLRPCQKARCCCWKPGYALGIAFCHGDRFLVSVLGGPSPHGRVLQSGTEWLAVESSLSGLAGGKAAGSPSPSVLPIRFSLPVLSILPKGGALHCQAEDVLRWLGPSWPSPNPVSTLCLWSLLKGTL